MGCRAERHTFTIKEDRRRHDAKGCGLETGFYFVRSYLDRRYSCGLRCHPDEAYALAKRMLLAGWEVEDAATEEFMRGMANVERAFEEDAGREQTKGDRGDGSTT